VWCCRRSLSIIRRRLPPWPASSDSQWCTGSTSCVAAAGQYCQCHTSQSFLSCSTLVKLSGRIPPKLTMWQFVVHNRQTASTRPSQHSLFAAEQFISSLGLLQVKKVNVAHTRLLTVEFRSWSYFLAVSLQVTRVINPTVGCHYFPPGPQLPSQLLRGLLPVSLLGEQRHDGCEQFA